MRSNKYECIFHFLYTAYNKINDKDDKLYEISAMNLKNGAFH